MTEQLDRPPTISDTLARMDGAWQHFWNLAQAFPGERLDERLSADWTRKQMLAHIGAWHDHASERLVKFAQRGEVVPLEQDVDVFNMRVARAAEGRTAGEILHSAQDSFRRLYRQVERLSDAELEAHDGWAAAVIAANSYEHYAEHVGDLAQPELEP
jgi:hypothetical protein